MARTRKTQIGGVPMWLRKFTQRVGNSAPWGLVQKFKKLYKQGVVTITEPKVTYNYIILSLKDGMQLNDKVSNIKDDIKLLQGYSTTNLNPVIDDLQIKLYGDGKITNNKIKPIFNDNIVALFNTGKLAFIAKIPKSITESDVYVIYREKNITRYELVSAYKGPIRIFLYMPSGMPSNIANLPKRNEHGLLPHELKAIQGSGAPHKSRPERPTPTQYIHTQDEQAPIINKPNNYNQTGNLTVIKAAKFREYLLAGLTTQKIEYLYRQGDNSDKFLKPIEFSVALAKITELPISSVAIYTMRNPVLSNQPGIPSLIYTAKTANNNSKLVVNVLDCDAKILKDGNQLKPNAFISNLPDSIDYIFGIASESSIIARQSTIKRNNNNKVVVNKNGNYAEPQNNVMPPHGNGPAIHEPGYLNTSQLHGNKPDYLEISKANSTKTNNITLDTANDLFTVKDDAGINIHFRAQPYNANNKSAILNSIAGKTLCSADEILTFLTQTHTDDGIKQQIYNIMQLQAKGYIIYLYADEDGSINYMNPDTQNNNKFGNNNNKIKTTVKYVLYAYK